MKPFAGLVIISFLMTGCGSEIVSHSEPVGLAMKVASGDVADGAVEDEKNVNTESGNPYGAFVAAANEELGAAPSRITVEGATVAVAVGSTGVTSLDEIFAGAVGVSFVMNGSAALYPVAMRTLDAGSGTASLSLDVDFDSDDLSDADYADLASGAFKIVVGGYAAEGFADRGADASLSLVITFVAYE